MQCISQVIKRIARCFERLLRAVWKFTVPMSDSIEFFMRQIPGHHPTVLEVGPKCRFANDIVTVLLVV
jgi:hypothetical protein